MSTPTVAFHLCWTYISSMLRLYLVRPLLSCPGSGGKNLTINLKNKSLVSDRGEKKRDYRRRTMLQTETLRSGNIWRKYEVRALILGQIWLTFDLFDQRFQQLQPNLQQKLVKTLNPPHWSVHICVIQRFLHNCHCGVWTPGQSTPSPAVSDDRTLCCRSRHLKPFAGRKSGRELKWEG